MNLVRFNTLSATLLLATGRASSTAAFVVGRGGGAAAPSRTPQQRSLQLFNKLFSSQSQTDSKYPIMADESVMSPKKHGTSDKPVQKKLRWNCDYDTADRICNFK